MSRPERIGALTGPVPAREWHRCGECREEIGEIRLKYLLNGRWGEREICPVCAEKLRQEWVDEDAATQRLIEALTKGKENLPYPVPISRGNQKLKNAFGFSEMISEAHLGRISSSPEELRRVSFDDTMCYATRDSDLVKVCYAGYFRKERRKEG